MINKKNVIKRIRIGITGCTGVVGSRLIELLSIKNADLTCLVRQSSKIDIDKFSSVKLIYGDLSMMSTLEEFVKDIDVCVHLAAQVSYTTKKEFYTANVIGTENLCKAILNVNSQCKLINCSSVAAYRMNSIFKMQYTDYAKSKRDAEKIVDYYSKNNGLRATTIIPGMIYGPGKNNLIPTVITTLKNGGLYFVSGGEKNAPLSYVEDLCNLFVEAIYNDRAIGNKYFAFRSEEGIHDFIRYIADRISCEAPSTVLSKKLMMPIAVVNELLHSFTLKKKHLRVSRRMVDILSINYQLDDRQKNNNLGWVPKTTMSEGLENTFKWLDNQKIH